MGFWIFLLGVLVLIAGICFFTYGKRTSSSARPGALALGALLSVLAFCLLFFDSFTTVPARSVAVQTAFGKVQGHPLGSGWHWVAPWNDIEKFDASVQTLKFYQAEKKDNGDCITVRLANNTNACVDVTAQWQINHAGDVNSLYLQYKTFDNIHDNLVLRQLQSALNEVFGTYDPLIAVGTSQDKPQTNTKDLQDDVKSALQRDLGTVILIPSVTIPLVHFDQATEDRLKAFQAAKADTQIAEQQKATAQAQADANKILAVDPSTKDPGVQYQNCLNLIRELGKAGQLPGLPPTFNCNQGGTGDPVLVQTK